MIKVFYSPVWFWKNDIYIDSISAFVLFLIAYFSIKFYFINKKKSHFYLALSFISLGVSFLFKILTNFTITYHILETTRIGIYLMAYQTVSGSGILFFLGFLLYRIFNLFG